MAPLAQCSSSQQAVGFPYLFVYCRSFPPESELHHKRRDFCSRCNLTAWHSAWSKAGDKYVLNAPKPKRRWGSNWSRGFRPVVSSSLPPCLKWHYLLLHIRKVKMVFFFLPPSCFCLRVVQGCGKGMLLGPLSLSQPHQKWFAPTLLLFFHFHQLPSDKFDLIAVLIFERVLR